MLREKFIAENAHIKKEERSQINGFPGGSVRRESACNAGDHRSTGNLVRSLGLEDLKKEMAAHSSILAWKIPWTEDTSGLESMGSQEPDTT